MAEPGPSAAPSSKLEPEHLIKELETSDTSSLSLILRTVYDGSEHNFMELLDARIKNHDKDIERMCNFHYQGFIDSIRELSEVRCQAQQLKKHISQVDLELQKSASKLLNQGEQLVEVRQLQSNIAAAIDSLSLCLPVFETYVKLKKQMDEKRYYPALKTLEQLEHTYLPRVPKYAFSNQFRESIPNFRESIKVASQAEFKEFLENIRKHTAKIGCVAMHQTAKSNNMQLNFLKKKRKKYKAPPPPNPFTGEIERQLELSDTLFEADEETRPQDLVDLAPVYRCLHIYSVLGVREAFATYYQHQRKEQVELVVRPPTDMQKNIEGFLHYFAEIVGFFVVEDNVFNTTSGLVTRAYLDEVWDMAVSKIVLSFHSLLKRCSDTELLLKIKNLVMLFSNSLLAYGYVITRLHDLRPQIEYEYVQRWNNKLIDLMKKSFEEDNFSPVQVKNEAEYQNVLGMFPYHDEALRKQSFPKRFPFSSFVLKIYGALKEYIHSFSVSLEDLNLSPKEVDEMVKKATHQLLTQSISFAGLFIKQTNLLQLIQTYINTKHLEDSIFYLEDMISNITGVPKDDFFANNLQVNNVFKVAQGEAESHICHYMNIKIDEFFQLAKYDWLLPESKAEGKASPYIEDLLGFLHNIFMSFTNLPIQIARTIYLSACLRMAECLMKTLLDKEIKQISMGALMQFNLDVMQCELFASAPIPELEDTGELVKCFATIRQMLDLCTYSDWSSYFHDYGQENNRYHLVSPNKMIILLEKICESDKKNVFTVLKKNEREKKKLWETILKQMRQLPENGT